MADLQPIEAALEALLADVTPLDAQLPRRKGFRLRVQVLAAYFGLRCVFHVLFVGS